MQILCKILKKFLFTLLWVIIFGSGVIDFLPAPMFNKVPSFKKSYGGIPLRNFEKTNYELNWQEVFNLHIVTCTFLLGGVLLIILARRYKELDAVKYIFKGNKYIHLNIMLGLFWYIVSVCIGLKIYLLVLTFIIHLSWIVIMWGSFKIAFTILIYLNTLLLTLQSVYVATYGTVFSSRLACKLTNLLFPKWHYLLVPSWVGAWLISVLFFPTWENFHRPWRGKYIFETFDMLRIVLYPKTKRDLIRYTIVLIIIVGLASWVYYLTFTGVFILSNMLVVKRYFKC